MNELVRGERVISSSLHGIILAESYGVPAVLYRPEGLDLPIFKYEDYYLGTGRSSFPVAKTVEEALAVTPCPVPVFTEQRQRLYRAFPADIWAD